jgi:Na+-translocating ferredoxin:NAD+ oxidoreductase RnfD subunit
MHKPGETVVSVDVGTAQQWLHMLVAFGSIACALVVVGALVGLILRRRPRLQIPIAVVVGTLVYALLEWRFSDFTEWSWHDPIASAAYQIGPVMLFFVASTLLGVAFVRRFYSRYAKGI